MMMRRIFILALYIIALILLIYIQAEFPNLNRKYGIPARYFDAVLLYSTGLLILAIVKRLVLGVYARRNNVDHDRTNNNFTLGVRRISSVIGAIILFISLLLNGLLILGYLVSISLCFSYFCFHLLLSFDFLTFELK